VADVATHLIAINGRAPTAFAAASGTVFPDALTGGADAAKDGTAELRASGSSRSGADVSVLDSRA
jgi:hypothetical protein